MSGVFGESHFFDAHIFVSLNISHTKLPSNRDYAIWPKQASFMCCMSIKCLEM